MNIPMWRVVLILLALGWAVMPKARAVELRIECPKEISPKNLRIVDAPVGWTPFVSSEYAKGIPLHSAGLMIGPPSDLAISKPQGGGAPNEEIFPHLRPSKEGNWMACYYGENLDFILSQRLPDAVTECRVAYSTDAKKRYSVDIRCRS